MTAHIKIVLVVTVLSTANQNEELRQELQVEKEEKRRLADRIQRMQVLLETDVLHVTCW